MGALVVIPLSSNEYQQYREPLKVFLKGSKKKKLELQTQHPELFKLFSTVWNVRERHMIKGYPTQYVFYLCCCFKKDCCHPLCQQKVDYRIENELWFPNGPPVSTTPLPFPDNSRPWNSQSCLGFCAGHFLAPAESLTSAFMPMDPRSTTISEKFKNRCLNSEELAPMVLLPEPEVKIWFEHLQTVSDNRKKGAQKASETRKEQRKVTTEV